MKERLDGIDRGYTVIAEVITQRGSCAAGHRIGDRIVFDGKNVEGPVCLHALYSFLPKVFAMRYGAEFPWLEDPDAATHACPDPKNPVIFQIRRVRDQ
ncbi:MAG: TIGR04076 family protein [Candidatus Latescibacteria bacterium]|nr:TIGR04076 family protein [bacterium]MBD3425478.1 TIGR04076 family protein [Candidatus Latescibacterota bacterium]